MPTPSNQAPLGPTSRAEKLSILSAMLGPDAMARIRDTSPSSQPDSKNEQVEVDTERATWHRNRLLERLRQQDAGRNAAVARESVSSTTQVRLKGGATAADRQSGEHAIGVENRHLDARLAKISNAETLSYEHPAIIARLIKSLPRDARVDALKSLPGPVARSIVRRLR